MTVSDGVNEPVSATVVVHTTSSGAWRLTAVNDDAGDVAAGTPVTVPVTANDTVSGGTGTAPGFRVTAVGTAEHGTVTFSDTSVTYTPNAGYSGRDEFTYTVTLDGTGQTSTASIVINVTAEEGTEDNTPPRFVDRVTELPKGRWEFSYNGTGGRIGSIHAVDDDGDTLFYTSSNVEGPFRIGPNGNVYRVEGALVEYPSQYTFEATVEDGVNPPVPTTVVVNATYEITAIDDRYRLPMSDGTPREVSRSVLQNDTISVSGIPLHARLVSGPERGTLTLNDDGTFTYESEPNAHYDTSFTYEAFVSTSGIQSKDSATVTISIYNSYDEDLLDAMDDVFDVTIAGADGVYRANVKEFNDTIGGVPLGIAAGTVAVEPGVDVLHGTLVVNSDGSIEYTPEAGYVGTDAFNYRLTYDGQTDVAAVTIHVGSSPNLTVNDDEYDGSMAPGESLDEYIDLGEFHGNVTDNDDFADATVSVARPPENGTLRLEPNGEFWYTPNAGYAGDDFFEYQVRVDDPESNEATTARARIKVKKVVVGILADTDAFEDDPNDGFTVRLVRHLDSGVSLGELRVTWSLSERSKRDFEDATLIGPDSDLMVDPRNPVGLATFLSGEYTFPEFSRRDWEAGYQMSEPIRFRAKPDGDVTPEQFVMYLSREPNASYKPPGDSDKGYLSMPDADRRYTYAAQRFTIYTGKKIALLPETPEPGETNVVFRDDFSQRASNCYALAALIAALEIDPSQIRGLFSPIPGGGYRVSFPGTAPIDLRGLFVWGEDAINISSADRDEYGNVEIWPLLYEQAIARWRDSIYGQGPYESMAGGDSVEAYRCITGRDAVPRDPVDYGFFNYAWQFGTLFDRFLNPLAAGGQPIPNMRRAIMFGTQDVPGMAGPTESEFGGKRFYYGHVYVMKSISINATGGFVMELIDPTGPHRTFNVPLTMKIIRHMSRWSECQ